MLRDKKDDMMLGGCFTQKPNIKKPWWPIGDFIQFLRAGALLCMRADGQGSNPIVQHLDELICCIKFTFEEVHRHECKQRVEVFARVS